VWEWGKYPCIKNPVLPCGLAKPFTTDQYIVKKRMALPTTTEQWRILDTNCPYTK